jgi:exo-poly-alpha-galacturonosidase
MQQPTSSLILKYLLLVVCTWMYIPVMLAAVPTPFKLMIAPGTLSDHEVTFLWDKQYTPDNASYQLMLNGKPAGTTLKTNWTFKYLKPDTWYSVSISHSGRKSQSNNKLNSMRFKTSAKGDVYNILDFGASPDSMVLNTAAIQKAINTCKPGGTVFIPAGTFLSGALFLKSNMTLHIDSNAVLKGSSAAEDYLPMIRNRFEGWEMDTYASLLNGGTLNRDGSYNIRNIRITGGGTIRGGGRKLGDAMIKAAGMRSRGRLICLMNAQNVELSYLTVTEPPSWTVHYIYNDNISCHDLKIITYRIRNGDGIDPDSSTGSYIFKCSFDTGDDCIAIKSGKNPEGYFVAKPTRNVRVTNCDFIRGHGISIGSEMSGGVSDVLIQDCKAGKLLHGMQIKATKDRGGYVRNITVTDCQLLQITIFSAVNYNNDGAAAPALPVFENFVFKNIDLSLASSTAAAININGFKDPAHLLKNVVFTNVLLPEKSTVIINDATQIKFINVKTASGLKPLYTITGSSGVSN